MRWSQDCLANAIGLYMAQYFATVQRLMGHANTTTTAGYERRGDRAGRDAVGCLHMAWRWEGGR